MSNDSKAIDSVLIVGFGGPTRSEHILPFLKIVTCGRGIPDSRLEDVAHHYRDVGGRSPYNDLADKVRSDLELWLADQGATLPVYCGMRNWDPYIADTIRKMNQDGKSSAIGVILAAHRTESSWGRYMIDVKRAVATNHGRGPRVQFLDACFDHPRFFEANAQRIEESTGYRRGSWPQSVPLLFTAHSIPVSDANQSTYVEDLMTSCQGVAEILGNSRWRLTYQSRSGNPKTPWLEPDINDAIKEEAAVGATEVVVQAIGFLSDHVEVLFDLDIEAKRTCDELGIKLHRAGCVNDHPEYVALLGEQILEAARQTA